ncbi:MAG TPA: hypothetical protein VNF49_00460 [Candidatus Binataceae bacterium]|nr:hypothetical protein [Candidatus Binataceae bacterium]
MAEEARHTYTIRLSERIAARIEEQATGLGSTPTTFIQSLVARQFDNSAPERGSLDPAALATLGTKLDALKKICESLKQTESERYGQLLFETVKTRSAIFHSLDQTLGATVVDEIIDASEKAARQYIARLAGAGEAKS